MRRAQLFVLVCLLLSTLAGCEEVVEPVTCIDGDGDGVTTCLGDCDDADPLRAYGLEEVCDGIDNNCDELLPPIEQDGDGDGFAACEGDCDNDDATRAPGTPELCNGLDDDCDNVLPNNELDLDGDGVLRCEGDCDDGDAAVNPSAPELCNGEDDDCDGGLPADESDADGDGESGCEGDCDDGDAAVGTGADELCNGEDDDCDGVVPASEEDADSDGDPGCASDCDDADPLVEGLDADGDGQSTCDGDCDDGDGALSTLDADGDGLTSCDGDCDDTDPAALPGAWEADGDGADSDCGGNDWTDLDDDIAVTWGEPAAPGPGKWTVLPDLDGDGGAELLFDGVGGGGSAVGSQGWLLPSSGATANQGTLDSWATAVFQHADDLDLRVVSDFDGDGVPEFAASVKTLTGDTHIFDGAAVLAGGTLTLADAFAVLDTSVLFAGPLALDLLAYPDVNSDGVPELIVGDAGSGFHVVSGASIVTGPPVDVAASSLLTVTGFLSGMERQVFLADLDGDSLPEVGALPDGPGGSTEIIAGATLATASGSAGIDTLTTWTLGEATFETGDFDGDGVTDFLVGGTSSNWLRLGASVLAGTATGTPDVDLGGYGLMLIGDVDGSGGDDIVIVTTISTSSPTLEIMLDPGLGPPVRAGGDIGLGPSPLAAYPQPDAVADLDGDGAGDIVLDLDGGTGPAGVDVMLSPY